MILKGAFIDNIIIIMIQKGVAFITNIATNSIDNIGTISIDSVVRDYHKDQQHCHEDQCKDRHRQHDHQDYDANHGPGLKRYINCSTKLKP